MVYAGCPVAGLVMTHQTSSAGGPVSGDPPAGGFDMVGVFGASVFDIRIPVTATFNLWPDPVELTSHQRHGLVP